MHMASDILKKRFDEIERLAYAAGLNPYDIHYFEVPADIIYQVASYGLPVRYSHWSFGRQYEHQKNQGEMGFSKIYELIINNNPSYAFLDDRNTDTTNLLICAHCYLPGTFVQTEDGIKPIEDVKSGDYVYSHENRRCKVKNPTWNVTESEVVSIQAGSYKFTQTSDHKLYAIRTSPDDRKKYRSWKNAFNNVNYHPQWVESGNLKPGDFLIVNKPKRLQQSCGERQPECLAIQIPIKKTLWKQKFDEYLEVLMDEDFGELVGLYLAEGYARAKGQMGLCFSGDETQLHDRSVELVSRYFDLTSRIKHSSTQNASTVEFNEICIAAYLREKLGHSCYDKHLPEEWMNGTSISFLRGVLRGFLLGDGTKSQPRTMGFTTTSSKLAIQMQQIGMHLGIFFGINPRDKSTPDQPRAISFDGSANGIYDNKVRELLGLPVREISRTWSGVVEGVDCFYVKINEVSSEEYSGMVYCLNVEEDHSFPLANGIITHNCLGHADFFANNIMFKEANEPDMVQVAKLHADNISEFRKEYGDDEVDEWLDIALSLERHIDPYKGRRRKRYPTRHTEFQERKPDQWEDIVTPSEKKPLIKKVLKNSYIPPNPEKDILWFLSEYSGMEDWQKRIFEIVRRESYYFFPQFRTKIINEGWASYWHAELMSQYAMGNDNKYGVTDIEHPLTPEEHLDFVTSHEKVVQPGIKIPLKIPILDTFGRPTGGKRWNTNVLRNPNLFNAATRVNPYYVGFRIFRDIKERWDQYYKDGYMEDDWGNKIPVSVDGSQKILQVRAEEDDVSFMRNYLTDELANDLNLFAFGSTEDYCDSYDVQEDLLNNASDGALAKQDVENKTIKVRTKDPADIVKAYSKSTANYGSPLIVVRRVDPDGLLRLEHLPPDDINVDINYAKHALKYIQKAWGHPVELIRKDKVRKITWVLAIDGDKLESDTMPWDYPESVES